MRKLRLLLCFFVLLCTYFHVNAQGNCPWHVNRNVIEATCLNNGGVEFFLLTDNGDTIAIDIENKKPVDPSINLSEIKFYHQSLTNLEDTTTYYTPNPRIFLKPGTYRVGVQAQCYNGGEGSGAYTPLSYEEIIEVIGSYEVPTVSILANIATSSWASGNRPTVPGDSTGRIQLRITGGSMPYTVILVNNDNHDTVMTRTITQIDNNGTNPNAANYKEYYSFDNLPAASYRFYFVDACDFRDTATSLLWTVEDARAPMVTDLVLNSGSSYWTNNGEVYTDSNVVGFYSVHLSEGDIIDYLYNAYAQHLQYRVCYGTADTSDWKAFPLNNLSQLNDKSYNLNNTLYDTAHHVGKYCDFLNQHLTFQYRNTLPGQHDTVSFYTGIIKNDFNYNHNSAEDVIYSGMWYDSCTYHIPNVHRYTNYYRFYRDVWGNHLSTSPNQDVWQGKKYYTYPLHYEIINNNDHSVIAETTLSSGFEWNVTKEMFEEHFGPISATMNIPTTIRITDAKGCVVSQTENIQIVNETDTLDGFSYLNYNNYYYEGNGESASCCQSLKGFSISERFSSENEHTHLPNPIPQRFKQTRDGAQFQLIKSPRNNKYNFTATYHYDTDDWEIVRADITNTAEITPKTQESTTEYQWGLLVRDYCLPYGYYDFLYITDCDTQTTTVYYTHPYPYEYRYEHTTPSYTSYQECDNYFITMQTGEYKQLKIGSDVNDPLQPEKVMGETVLNTYFKIVDGPQGGYPTEDFRLGRTIRLTVPGTYTLRMYTPDTSEYCRAPYFDTTITYTGGTVSFDYAYAYVCDADSTVGFFYCQAKDGMAPYTYRLYQLTNMEGNLLEENSTGSFKGLSNIHVGDMMSLEVGDACGRSYYVNITVTDLSSSRLAWFDGALRVTETCEGSEIDVYISAVEEDFTYHWKGPNGFDVTTPRGHIVIGRGSEPGDYTVEIGNTGCSQTLKDTVTLGILPAPKVEMSYGTNTVCPGQNVTLSFTPTQGTGTITYIIGREINSIDTFYNFSGIVGETASLEYTATSEATFWIHKVEDEICNYTIPEDTVKITLRDVATACDVTVSSPQICFDATAELTASSSTMVKPYTIRWYDNPYQQNVLKTDVIEEGMSDASFTTGKLQADSTLYVTIQDATHCETYTGTVNQWMNMDNGTTPLTCGQSIRLFDDGGSNGNYLSGKYYKHTFTSTDGNLITLSFNSFNTQLNGDVMRVYTGAEVLQDSLLALISGSNLPESLTSNGTSMTIVFVSNSATEAEGWDALVSCSALPAQANIKVLEDLSVTLSISPEMPARYGQSYTLTAVANGGQGSRYEFTWHITDKDYNEIQSSSHELASNTDIYNLDNLTETRNVWVVVKDKSDYPCTTKDKMSNLIQIEIADIALNLELSSTVNEICQGDIPMIVKIKNEGSQTANNVKVKLALPDGMSLTDEADSLILFPEINAQGTVYDTLFIRNEAHVSTSTSMDIRAQIWSCDQGDNNSNWHNWDWTGNPNEADESIYTLTIRPSLDIVNAPGLTVSSADICFGGDATIQAHSNLDYPQHFIWYADAALTQVIKDTTLENNTSIIVSNEFTNITQEGALCYVMVENSNYCPAYTTVDYRTKMQYAPTDTILMHNGSSMVGNADHIRFFDDGGADNNYAPNKRYGYLFTSVDGSPLAIYFDENNYIYNYNNNARIEIYDGESDMTPRIARYTNSQMRDKVLVATTGKMFIKFYSDDYTDQGISAHVFTTSRAMVAEADVTFKTPMAASEITTTDDQVCYGENATLTASTPNLAFPQTHYWYDENLNPVDTITVEAADAHSTLPISSVTSASNYYVTVSNADECPVPVENNQMLIEPLTNNDLQLNTSTNGRATNITNQDIYAFYDEGGANNDYFTHDANWTHTFTATDGGEITLFIKSFESESCCDYMRIYDGASTSGAHMTELRGANSNLTYTSTTGSITIFWHTDGSVVKSGWDALVYTSTSLMAKATASVKAGAPESIITTNEVAVCFGSDAVLNASSNLSTYPQYFYWYNADRTEIVHRDIVENPGESSSYSFTPTSETFYYVTVTNSDNCPIDESQLPQDTNNLVKIKVTFSEPVISNNVMVNDATACYGESVTLNAITNDGTEKHIYWYDENFHLINDKIGTSSTIEPQVSGTTVYYVNAVETNECGILPPSYGKFFFDASKNGGTTNLTTGEMIPFYDAGGPNANYNTPGADWTHTFVAPAGKQVTLKMNSYYTSGHRLFIYDGNTNNLRREFNGNYGENMNEEPITSTTGKLIVRWFIDYNPNSFNYPGWEGEIGVLDANGEMHVRDTELATAHVSMKSIADQLASITTTDDQVCYGENATLTASAPNLAFPQTHYWYDENLNPVDTITVEAADAHSTLPISSVTSASNYYVTVSNADECPVPVENNQMVIEPLTNNDLQLNTSTNGRATNITNQDIYAFYDEGGANNDYFTHDANWTHTFTATDGGEITLFIKSFESESCCDYMRIYDGASTSGAHMTELRGANSNLTYTSTTGSITIFWHTDGSVVKSGWDALVYTTTSLMAKATASVKAGVPESITTNQEVAVCFGSDAVLNASSNLSTYPQYFYWYNADRTEIVHRDTVENPGENSSYSFTPTSETFYYVTVTNSDNCPIDESQLPQDTNNLVKIKVTFSEPVISNNVMVNDATACYGESVTLTATLTNGGSEPQHFVWYDEESYIVKEEVTTGSSSFTVVATEEAYYYVNVSGINECPILSPDDNVGDFNLPYGHISLKAGVPGAEITTTDDEVCFGGEAALTATSTIAFPQYYTWYAPDRITILKQETVTAGGHSTLTVTPDEETDYYVAITNDENCPIVNQIHNHYVEILMDGYDSYSLSPSDSVGFFDAGGENGNYLTGWSGDYNFYAEEGSKIRIHFDTVQLARDAYIQIYDGDNNNSTVAHITGSRGNLDYTVESNRLRVYFSGYSDMSAPGWKAYVYSLNPRDENELAAAHVSFMQPTFNSSQITTTNAEACLGGMAELTAISTLTSNQYFAWYDNEMNLLKQEVIPSGEYSELPVEVLTNTTYYVNVSTENECPALPPHYGEFCFDASQDGHTTFIETGHALNFYDDGGENNNYSDNANNWTHIFKAPSGGHVRIVINSFYTEGCDYLYIYDGSSTDVSPVATLSSNQGGYTYTSTSESLTVKWYSDGSVVYAGWDALIGVPDVNDEMVASAFELKSVGVTVIQPTLGLPVTTTNDTVCYGSEAHLTATSTIDYPQYYTWYAPDAHTVLLRDTVDGSIKTESSLNAPNYYQYQDQQYYVALGNGDNCPPVIAEVTNTKTVLLNSNAHEQTTQLAPNEVAKFYDAGGRENSYHDHNSDYTHTFQVQQGKIKVKFTDNNMSICSHDTLYVYDSDHADDSRLLGKVINERDDETDQRVMNYNNLSYYSTGRYMTFQFKQGDNSWCSGWNATVMPYNIESELTTAEVNVKISSVPEMSITTRSDTVCYGSAATVSASANLQYPQYYTWYNNQMEALMHDTLFDASETESVLNLPAHYINENYYAYVYSDTVSCIMDMDAMPKRYSEVYLSNNMDGGETLVTPYDSIRFFNADNLHGLNTNNSTYVDYYFTAESGQIQIKFDELTCNGDCYMAFIVDDINDIGFGELGRGTWQNYTVTSLNNTMHLHLYMYRSTSYAQWRATVTNVNANNTAVLSKMALADVVVEVNNSAATLRTTNDTVCIGSPAMLTASSDIAYPQYYTWYNEDLSSILFEDTIASGSSNFYIPGQVGNATYYAMASNDTTCTLRPVKIHDNFREYIFDDNLAGKSLFVGATDSIVIYDDGGKYGDYIVSEEEYVRIMKLETYPGATITAQVTSLEIDSEEDVMLAFVNGDEQGNLNPGYEGENVVSLTGTLSNTYTYRSEGNVLYIGWIMEDEDALPMAGFEMTVTADMHPESYLAEAQVIMRNGLPMDYNAITDATSTVICKGDDATLEATSNLTENPQYFLWYSSDLSRVIGADTVYSGSTSHVSIPNLMQDTLLYVAVGTDAVCPAYPMEHKLIRELNLNTTTNAHTTQLTAVDSVLFFDDGGKNSHYTFTRGYLSHTFKANSGHVVFNLHELSITDCDDENFLAVVDGEFDIENVDEDSIRAMYYAEEIPTGDSIIISTGNTLSIVFVSDHMHEEEPNNGWYASIYTTEQMSSDMGTVTPAEVTVNPSYQFEVYDTTNASRAPYSTADNMFRNIDVSAEGELIIDSVFHTALGCDSTYTLHLMVLPATVQDIVIASNSNSWTYDGWYHREEVYTVVYGLDTLTADAGSDGKVFTMPGTGDILTITPDATAEVIYFTPTPVPNSFSYTLDNEADYPSVTTDTGTLEITPIATEITITANSASKYHDGTPLTNDGFTYTPTDILVEGDTLVAEIVGTITEIGDSLNRVVSYQVLRNVNFNRRGLASYTQDVTNCYTFALPVSGTLSIVDTFTVSCEVVNGGRICPGSNDGTATITIEGGKDVSPDRYEYSIVGDNTGYNNTGHTEGEIILNTLSPDSYTVTATDALGLTATATFSIVERPVITTTTVFECPNNIDTVIKHSGCNITLMDIGTPNFVAPAGMDMADVTIYNNAPADHIYEVGETTVTWVAKGMCGDSVTCDQIIKVSFQTCPDAVDFEGNSYPSVRLGSGCKCWTTENLVSTKYSDGRDIDDVMDYYSYEYPDVATNVSIFGHLYNWYSAADTARYGSVDSVERAYHSGNHIQGICPDGWYLPSDEEYDELNIYPTTDLRSTEYWIRVNGVVNTNATGFNSLPGGMYNCSTGRFESMMGNSYYWTCHPVYDLATGAMIDYICEKIVTNNNSRCNGYSIRCIWGEH